MKANKIFAVALAALALVACKKTPDEPKPTTLALNETEIKVQVDATFQLTANLEVRWASSNEAVATVANGLVKGIAAGEANITATATDGQKAVCKVTVEGGTTPPPAGNPYDEFAQLQGKAYYVFFLQSGAMDYLGDKVLYYFGPNNHNDETLGKEQGSRWLYIWNNPAVSGGTAVGTDPFDMAEGWTCIKQVDGWCSGGLCVAINGDNNVSEEGVTEDFAALNDIQKNITNYDEWYFAIALKNNTQGAGYDFEIIGSNVDNVESGKGSIHIDPAATGEWVYKEYKLSEIKGLEFGNFNHNGSNLFVFICNPFLQGAQLDLGYAFLYKK